MTGDIDALGAAVDSAITGRVLQDKAGENQVQAEGNCLNCDTPLTTSYCGECGQPAHVHRSLGAFWHDILHGVLHFEGKFWRTLPLLAWHPGKLTRRYIHGERAKFISPMALFLFSVFMVFALFAAVGDPFPSNVNSDTITNAISAQEVSLDKQILETEEKLKAIDLKKREVENLNQKIEELTKTKRGIAVVSGDETVVAEIKKEAGLDGNVTTAWPWLADKLEAGFKRAKTNPSLLFYKLKANGYKFAWALIPISVPFVWLLMIGKRGLHFYDHAVFTTYSISFMMLFFLTVTLLGLAGVGTGIIVPLVLLYPIFHMYRHLRHTYQLSRFGSFIRLILLLSAVFISLVLFIVMLLTLGLLG